jgi:hypothetical protein
MQMDDPADDDFADGEREEGVDDEEDTRSQGSAMDGIYSYNGTSRLTYKL